MKKIRLFSGDPEMIAVITGKFLIGYYYHGHTYPIVSIHNGSEEDLEKLRRAGCFKFEEIIDEQPSAT